MSRHTSSVTRARRRLTVLAAAVPGSSGYVRTTATCTGEVDTAVD
ncbi:hypothetical protein ACI79G_13665 [Geodermatophilus sp. SYSU D00779]